MGHSEGPLYNSAVVSSGDGPPPWEEVLWNIKPPALGGGWTGPVRMRYPLSGWTPPFQGSTWARGPATSQVTTLALAAVFADTMPGGN